MNRDPDTGRFLPGHTLDTTPNLPHDPITGKVLPGPGPKSNYDQAIAAELCRRLTDDDKPSLRRICKDLGIAPSTALFWVVEEVDPWFTEQYRKAREAQAELLAEETIEIADTEHTSTKTKEWKGIISHETYDNVDRSRLRIGGRQWLAAKFNPRKYADKQQIEHTGSIELVARMAEGTKRAAEASKALRCTSLGPAVPSKTDPNTD
jgi:hypothetical protein